MSKSWLGDITSIVLDWHEGVFVETEASPPALLQTISGPMLGGSSGVYFDAKCCLCEWAYCERTDGRPVLASPDSAPYGYRTPDIEEVLRWANGHRASRLHLDAVQEFHKTKRLMAAAGAKPADK